MDLRFRAFAIVQSYAPHGPRDHGIATNQHSGTLGRLTLPVSHWRRAGPIAPALLLPPSAHLRIPVVRRIGDSARCRYSALSHLSIAPVVPTCRLARNGLTRARACQQYSPLLRTLAAVIFDVDGVILASPHEHAWREALRGIADPARFTTEFYQTHVAGKPRLSGARAALEHLEISDAVETCRGLRRAQAADPGGTDRGARFHGLPRCASLCTLARCEGHSSRSCLVVEERQPDDAFDPSCAGPDIA